jgi:hypothetical protein
MLLISRLILRQRGVGAVVFDEFAAVEKEMRSRAHRLPYREVGVPCRRAVSPAAKIRRACAIAASAADSPSITLRAWMITFSCWIRRRQTREWASKE